MKAEYLKVEKPFSHTINIRKDVRSYFFDKWHYHSVLELVYILKGEGVRFVGDNISRFESGDLVLLGVNLPHVWKSDEKYFDGTIKNKVSAIVLHFPINYLGESMWELPEFSEIKELLSGASRGIVFDVGSKHPVKKYIRKMLHQPPLEQLMTLTALLNEMLKVEKQKILSGVQFAENYNSNKSKRIDRVYDFVLKNFEHDVKVDNAAELVHMTTASFCRFFKQKTGKTFSEFTNEVRIRYACRLLTEGELSVSEVCFKCGYKSLSYFNRKFKSIVGINPSSFVERKKMFDKREV